VLAALCSRQAFDELVNEQLVLSQPLHWQQKHFLEEEIARVRVLAYEGGELGAVFHLVQDQLLAEPFAGDEARVDVHLGKILEKQVTEASEVVVLFGLG